MYLYNITQITVQVNYADVLLIISIAVSGYMILTVINDSTMAENNEKKGFNANWKDLIWLITLVVGMSSSYFSMQSKVSNLERQVTENSKMLNDNNLELIKYKLEQVQKSQDDFSNSFNKFLDDYYRSNR